MKKSRRLIIAVAIVILLSMCQACFGGVYAKIINRVTGEEYTGESTRYAVLPYHPSNKFEFNSSELLRIYALRAAGDSDKINVMAYMQPLNPELIAIKGISEVEDHGWNDGDIDASDGSIIDALGQTDKKISHKVEWTTQSVYAAWATYANDIRNSLAVKRGLSMDDVKVTVTVTTPAIEGITTAAESFTIDSDTKITEEILQKIERGEAINKQVSETTGFDDMVVQYITVVASTPDGSEYTMVMGTDENYYLMPTKIVPDKTEYEFTTDLSYRAEVDGKEVEGRRRENAERTFLPPYYDNEDSNAKKDADAIAIIKSKTDEGIASVNGVDMIEESNKPNSEGWYYPDVNDKTIIEKVYPFDSYNNTTYNGAITEYDLALVGTEGGKDTQSPSIEWTLRRINYEEVENKDGSITVTITYNLPIDPDSIEEGWTAIYDETGDTNAIHKITRTFKKGEDYDKNVVVERNGPIEQTVTTPVKIKWEKLPEVIPQAGKFSIVLAIIVAGIVVFTITRYRKLRK